MKLGFFGRRRTVVARLELAFGVMVLVIFIAAIFLTRQMTELRRVEMDVFGRALPALEAIQVLSTDLDELISLTNDLAVAQPFDRVVEVQKRLAAVQARVDLVSPAQLSSALSDEASAEVTALLIAVSGRIEDIFAVQQERGVLRQRANDLLQTLTPLQIRRDAHRRSHGAGCRGNAI